MNDLLQSLLQERFGPSSWFRAVPPETDSTDMQTLRQLELDEAVDDEEEVADALVQG